MDGFHEDKKKAVCDCQIKNHTYVKVHGEDCCTHSSLMKELICHFPFAVFSVSLSMIIIGLMSCLVIPNAVIHRLFHNFHFLHIVFAATGVILTFGRYSSNLLGGISAGLIIPTVFCTLSDSILPYLGGEYLGIQMQFHWCFISHLHIVIPFLIIGILNGYVLSKHFGAFKLFYSKGSHFLHIFVSSMAGILYLVSYGFSNWGSYMSFVFVYLILAVLIPCTMADIVIPTFFAKIKKS